MPAVLPTFTNPNNVSIVCGAPPQVHGIAGNYYLDRESGQEIMITDGSLMRCDTILAQMSHCGVSTAAITAKDKLRKMLGRNLSGISFSSERAADATLAENGIENVERLVGRPAPHPYSADLSLYVLDAGLRLLERRQTDLLYLSLSDFVQHAHAPGEAESNEFLRAVDARVKQLVELGAVVGLVADHGMNDKANADGTPNVIFLEEELERSFGEAAVRVICPITDPFVRHHGALGSFVRVYLRQSRELERIMQTTARLPGVAMVMAGEEAARRFEMPLDREGDFVALADQHTVIGSRRSEHDLSGLAGHRLRSHGGLMEQRVPFLLSRPLNSEYQTIAQTRRLRNFHIFEFALNGTS
jgi:phosphonoacetate hydrolase